MIDKPDPAKDAGAKRPHATLDLKATEVKPAAASASTPASAATPSSTSSASTTGASSASSASSATTPPKASATSTPSPAGAKPATSSASSATSDTSAKASPASTSSSKTAPPATAKSGGGVFSHLAAGLVGGALAYAGAAFLGPISGFGPAGTGTSELSSRIAALETDIRSGDLGTRLGNAEGQLAKIEAVEKSLAELREAQSTLGTDTRALVDTARSEGAGAAERLKKIEDQLALMAAGTPGENGAAPNLAAITGKISDLESALDAQRDDLAKRLAADTDQRIDSELSGIRTEQARAFEKAQAARAEAERVTAALEAMREEQGKIRDSLSEVRTAVDSQLRGVARPADVTAAVSPVSSKLAELEQSVRSVVKSEESRKQNAERIVLALELSNLKRALDRGEGHGYSAELAEVEKASGGTLDLVALQRFKDSGVATPAELKAEFRPLVNVVIDAEADPVGGSVIDRLMAGAKSVVRVRKVSHEPGDTSAEAIVARMEAALDSGRLGVVVSEANTLPKNAQEPIEDWLVKVTARHSVDLAIARVEERLKSALAGTPDADGPPPGAVPAQH